MIQRRWDETCQVDGQTLTHPGTLAGCPERHGRPGPLEQTSVRKSLSTGCPSHRTATGARSLLWCPMSLESVPARHSRIVTGMSSPLRQTLAGVGG